MAKLRFADITDDIINDIKLIRTNGATMDEVASHYEVSRRSLYQWAEKSPELKQALEDAKVMSKTNLSLVATSALFDKLRTRTIVTEKITNTWTDADGELITTQVTTKEKTLEPSEAIVMYALPRLLPEYWDSLAVRRLENGLEDGSDYTEIINAILDSAKE